MSMETLMQRRLQAARFWYEQVPAKTAQESFRLPSTELSALPGRPDGEEAAREGAPSPKYRGLLRQSPAGVRRAALCSGTLVALLAILYVVWRRDSMPVDGASQMWLSSWRLYILCPSYWFGPLQGNHYYMGHLSQSSLDYALQDNGGSVACDLTTGCFQIPFSIPRLLVSPNHAITDSQEAWWFRSSFGQLGVTTNVSIYPTLVTVEYPFDTGGSVDEAPCDVALWGMIEGEENERRFKKLDEKEASLAGSRSLSPGKGVLYSKYRFVQLAEFQFSADSRESLQTFLVKEDIRLSEIHFNVFVLAIRSNWGGKRTGVRRLQLHGRRAHTVA